MEGEGDSVYAVEKAPRREHAKKSPGYKVRRLAAGEQGCSHCGLVHAKDRDNTARRMGESVASVTVWITTKQYARVK